MKKISVIIPVYNCERYLNQCLDSVLNQTLTDYELICIDDASTDKSNNILKEYEKSDSRIKVLLQDHKGAAAARNLGIQNASGEYLLFLDADDFFEKEMFQTLYDNCIASDADVGVCNARLYNDSTGEYQIAKHLLNMECLRNVLGDQTICTPEEINTEIFTSIPPAPWNKLFKRCFILQHGFQFQDLPNSNDLFFTYISLASAQKIVLVDEILVNYRINNSSSLQGSNTKGSINFYKALSLLQEELKKKGIYKTFEKSFKNRALSTCLWNLKKSQNFEAFESLCTLLKEEAFYSFNIFGHSKKYFRNRKDYSLMIDVMCKDPLEIWEILMKENTPFVPYVPKINIDEWNPESSIAGSEIKVSIIIPCYNVEMYFEETMQSVLNQTLKDIEVICVNDGSTDNTLAILEAYAKKDARIHIIDKPNGGASSARNVGLAYAKGEYIYYLDSDDYIHEKAMEYLYHQMKKRDLDMLFFSTNVFYENEEIHQQEKSYDTYYIRKASYPDTLSGIDMYVKCIQENEFRPSPCLYMTRSEFLRNSNILFYEGIIMEDQLYTMECMMLADKVAYDDIHLYYRRVRANSVMTGSNALKKAYTTLLIERELINFIDEHQLSNNLELVNAIYQKMWQLKFINLKKLVELSEEDIDSFLQQLSFSDSNKMYNQIIQPMYLYKKTIRNEQRIKNLEDDNKMLNLKNSYITSQLKDEIKTKKALNVQNVQLKKSLNNAKEEQNRLKKEKEAIYSSMNYRVGKYLLFIPKKILSFIIRSIVKVNSTL